MNRVSQNVVGLHQDKLHISFNVEFAVVKYAIDSIDLDVSHCFREPIMHLRV